MRAAFRIGLGVILVLVGITGLLLPVMPGWVFLIPGLVILGDYFPPIKRLVTWAKNKAEKHGVMGGDKPKDASTSQSPSSSSSPAPDTYQP